jgi:ribokinase/adenosine kinase
VVVTRGARGADLYVGADHIHLPRVEMPQPPVDPMGCGDAFRAGLMYGISHQLDWQLTGRLANMIGAIKVTTAGCQNHFSTGNSCGPCTSAPTGSLAAD